MPRSGWSNNSIFYPLSINKILLDILHAILDDQKANNESSSSLDSFDEDDYDDLSKDVSSFNSIEKRASQVLHKKKRPTESIKIQSFAS